MKLIECYVENFGKLHQFQYHYEDGFNSILQLNGWGKTTFASFIKAMFYGMDASRRKNLDEDERRKYMPWQGGRYGGYVIFEAEDREYRVERFFAESVKDDSFILYDQKTGLETHDYSEQLGEDLFKLDREAFSRSAFIPQQAIEISANDSISTKLGNLIESENDMNHFDPAKEKLDRARKEYIKTGGRGKIALAENRLTELQEERLVCRTKNKQALEKTAEKKKINERKILIKEESDESERIATKLLTIQGEMKPYELSSQEQLRIEVLASRFEGNIPSDSELNEKESLLKNYHDNEIKIQTLDSIRNTVSEKSYDRGDNNKHMLLLIIAPIVAVLGIVLGFLGQIIASVICIALAVILFVLAVFISSKQKAEEKERKIQEEIRERDAKKFKDEQETIENDVRSFLSEYTESEVNSITELENQIKDLRSNRIEYLRLKDKLSRYEELKNTKIEGHTLAEIQAKKRMLDEEYAKINEEENQLSAQIDILDTQAGKSAEIEDEIQSLTKFIAESKKRYDNLSIAMTCLDKAKEQIAIHYMEDMQKAFRKYVGLLDKDANLEKNVSMDVNLNVSVLDYGTQWSTEYFSAGYKDLIGICARFALIDALFEDEKPFLVLDDPFVNLDKGKLGNALDLLEQVSKQYQIIYLTCHDSRSIDLGEKPNKMKNIDRSAEFVDVNQVEEE